MPDLKLRLGNDMVIVEGAMGTMLMEQGADANAGLELLNLIEPETVGNVHRLYRLAGADCAISNTFGGTRARLATHGLDDQLEEINRAGVRIAKEQNPEHVLADIGPSGLSAGHGGVSFSELVAQFSEQARALAKESPDAFLIETMIDINEARAAIFGVREVSDLPVICTCSFGEHGTTMISGTPPEACAVTLQGAGADCIGMNCGMDSESLFPLMERMGHTTGLPLMVQPNAGLPKKDAAGKTYYDQSPEEAARWALRFRDIGVQFIGSCCGSTPSFTAALTGYLEHLPVIGRNSDEGVFLASSRECFKIGDTGCEQFEVFELADYAKTGAASDALPDPDALLELEEDVMATSRKAPTLFTLGGADSALELSVTGLLNTALRAYPGRAAVQLGSCEDADESGLRSVLQAVKRYGAAIRVKNDACPAATAAIALGLSKERDLVLEEG